MTERTNLLIIAGMIALSAYSLYQGETEMALAFSGALATALTTIVRSTANEKSNPAGPVDNNGV